MYHHQSDEESDSEENFTEMNHGCIRVRPAEDLGHTKGNLYASGLLRQGLLM